MPITVECSCGKTLEVSEALAGRKARCPVCSAVVPIPDQNPAYEVVDDPSANESVKGTPSDLRPRAKAIPVRTDSRSQDQTETGRKPWEQESAPKEDKPSHFAMERRILSGGVIGGVLAMIGAVVWFVVGLMADHIFFYPPSPLCVRLDLNGQGTCR